MMFSMTLRPVAMCIVVFWYGPEKQVFLTFATTVLLVAFLTKRKLQRADAW